MDFAALPPEINSGLMYAGPGSGPMLAAASAWDGLAAELHSTATAYETVVSRLTGEAWLGPSSAAMAAAIIPYLAWLTATGAQAEQTANQVRAVAAAYQTAFVMTVPPAVVAANRAQLMVLIATNVLGQNTAAIAANEAHYAEMWAQDSAAMYGYAGSASAATKLTPFNSPQQTANPAGPSGQAAAATQATGNAAGTGTQTAVTQSASVMPHALQALASPLPAQAPVELVDLIGLLADVSGLNTVSGIALGVAAAAWASAAEGTDQIMFTQDELIVIEQEVLDRIDQLQVLMSASQAPVSASIGQAIPVGKLSVPLNWVAAAPEMRSVTQPLPGTNPGAAPPVSPAAMGTAFSQMGLAGMAGSALAGSVSSGRGADTGKAGVRPVDVPASSPGGSGKGIADQLREFAELRDSGIMTDEEFADQKRHLLAWFAATLAPRVDDGETDPGTRGR